MRIYFFLTAVLDLFVNNIYAQTAETIVGIWKVKDIEDESQYTMEINKDNTINSTLAL